MAADMKARQDRYNTIAFTLPISCQVCLGKVKQPVLCPNNHVFCSMCMDIWLQKNKQCPACRVSINPENPVKKILGGVNEATEENMSNPELRKARFDLLYKEYEDEFERLTSEVKLLKTENEVLRQQVRSKGGSSYSDSKKKEFGPQATDTNGLLLLTKKLQDAQKLYEKVKTELSKTKEENNNLKDENVNLNRENQKLRTEIASRSPHRYGRYTVSTLEAKISSYEKEVGQLHKALEKSDKYIEDLQAELEISKGSRDKSSRQPSRTTSSEFLTDRVSSSKREDAKRHLFDDKEGRVNGESYKGYDDHYKYYNSSEPSAKNNKNGSSKGKRVTFDLPKDRNETTSFDLEMPSPMSSKLSLTNGSSDSPVKGVLKKKSREDMSDSFNLSKPWEDLDRKEDTDILKSRSSRSSNYLDDDLFRLSSKMDKDLNSSYNLEEPDKLWSGKSDRHDFDDTKIIESELDELDISVTPDFTDCMKLLNRAEKKVHNRTDKREDDPEYDTYKQDYLGDYKSGRSDPLTQKYSTGSDLSSKPENPYTKYYNTNTDRPVTSNSQDIDLSERYPTVSSLSNYKPSAGSYKPEEFRYSTSDKYSVSSRDPDDKYSVSSMVPGDKYSVPPLESGNKYSVSSLESGDKYSVPTSSSKQFSASSENYLHTSDNPAGRYGSRENLYASRSSELTTSGGYKSLPTTASQNKYTAKPLGKSVFGKSPSLDNLFMSTKNSAGSQSRFATAEDIDSMGYKSRYSLPGYSSSTVSKFSSDTAHSGRISDIGATTKESVSSSLPPKSVRMRSHSDMGTSVASLTTVSGHHGSTATSDYNKRFGHIPASSSSASSSSSSYLPLTSVSTNSTSAHPSLKTYPSTFESSSVPSYKSSYPSKSEDDGRQGAYSGYLSNNSTYDFSKSDSFLPEPKKRLFESSDDMDLSLSPIKSTRKM